MWLGCWKTQSKLPCERQPENGFNPFQAALMRSIVRHWFKAAVKIGSLKFKMERRRLADILPTNQTMLHNDLAMSRRRSIWVFKLHRLFSYPACGTRKIRQPRAVPAYRVNQSTACKGWAFNAQKVGLSASGKMPKSISASGAKAENTPQMYC